MSDIKVNFTVKEENFNIFKRCLRKLLESTFIVGAKDEALYDFVARESNRQEISDYLRMIGFDIFVEPNVQIAMLRPYEGEEDEVGLKRANAVTFTTEQYHLLLVLWELYLENLGRSEDNLVLRGDLVDKLKAYEVGVDGRKLSAAMKLFKKYNLIDYDEKDTGEDGIITLYPSLQFGWNVEQFQTVAREYMKAGTDTLEPEEDSE